MNRQRRFLTPLLLILSFLALKQVASAQTAQVTGIITDADSAVIAGAQLTLTNVDTSVARKAVTNSDGYYSIPFVPPGNYQLNVLADGFKPVTRNNLSINVDQASRNDFTLEIGAINESVNITAVGPPLERENSSIGHVIENKSIVTLPLNGRNYSQLALLMPGVTPNQGSRAADGFSVNGNRTLQNKFLVDGLDNNNYILGVDTGSTQAIRPSVDAIQEFKVESANYSAQYGQAAGVISVAIKSGTNSFHGSAFEFLRNEKLDANDFFANRAGLKRGPLRFNQFGGTLGGPVWRNRTFFFASFQGTRTRASSTSFVTVPTPEQLRGNFGSINIYDPANVVGGNRQQFAGNLIPEGRMDPVGRKIAALYPAPNLPGPVNNYASLVTQSDDANQYDFRADHNFSERDKLFARFSKFDRNILRGSICPAPGNCGAQMTLPIIVTNDAWSAVVGGTHIFSSNAVNELRLGYSNNQSFQQSLAEKPLFDEFGIKGVPQFDSLTGLPLFTLTNYSALGNRIQTPNPKEAKLFQINDNFSNVRGRHTMNFGGEYWRLSTFVGTANTARGSFDFTGQFTSRTLGQGLPGNAVADLLLGLTASASITTPQLATFLVDYYSGYFSDSWTISPKVTVNLGVRYELQTRQREEENRQAFFDYTPGSPTYGTVIQAGDGGHRERAFSNLDKNNFAPRIGLAWQLNQRTVIRGGFGIFYSGVGYYAGNFSGAANPPYFVRVAINSPTTAANTSLKLSNGFPSDVLNPVRAVNPALYGQPRDFPQVNIYQGNIDVQRQLGRGMVLSVAYIGSSTAKLSGLNDINAPKPGPGAAQPRRLFPTFGAINTLSGFAHASYHSLQTKLERRFQFGFSMLSSYTWSHSIDNSTDGEDNSNGPNIPQDSLNTDAEKASSGFDITQRFVTSVVYDLPLGRADGWLGGSKLARAVFNGFQIGGIFVAQTGQPVNPDVAGNPANTTNPVRPNRLSDGNLPRSERNVDRWFDPTAFAAPAAFTYGNSGRNVLRAPGLVNLDFLVGRNFRLTETSHLELRGEFFNLTNTAHFGRPNATIGSLQAGRITTTAVPNRQVQIGLRLTF